MGEDKGVLLMTREESDGKFNIAKVNDDYE